MASAVWTDLLDPGEAELREHVPGDLHPDSWRELLRPADPHGAGMRPKIKGYGSYVLGLLLIPVAVPAEDLVYYQELDFILTSERIVTIRKTPGARSPFETKDVEELTEARHDEEPPGMIAYHLVDEVAERFLDL